MKFDMQNMLQQAQKMQEEMEKVRAEVNQKTVTAEAGGGMVSVTMTGANEVKSVKIAKEAIDTEDVEMLEDLIVAAMNKAVKETSDMVNQEMGKMSNMLPNIPGFNLNI